MYDVMFGDLNSFIKFFKENDSEENREAILKTSKLRYWYCRHIEDRPEVWGAINNCGWAYCYCRYVEDRPEVWSKINSSEWAYRYCNYIIDRPEVRKYV